MYGHMEFGTLELDIHGMTKYQAGVYLESQIKKAGKGVYKIRVIHGFHGGTELRDFVRREVAKNPKVIRTELGINQGETVLILRELY